MICGGDRLNRDVVSEIRVDAPLSEGDVRQRLAKLAPAERRFHLYNAREHELLRVGSQDPPRFRVAPTRWSVLHPVATVHIESDGAVSTVYIRICCPPTRAILLMAVGVIVLLTVVLLPQLADLTFPWAAAFFAGAAILYYWRLRTDVDELSAALADRLDTRLRQAFPEADVSARP